MNIDLLLAVKLSLVYLPGDAMKATLASILSIKIAKLSYYESADYLFTLTRRSKCATFLKGRIEMTTITSNYKKHALLESR